MTFFEALYALPAWLLTLTAAFSLPVGMLESPADKQHSALSRFFPTFFQLAQRSWVWRWPEISIPRDNSDWNNSGSSPFCQRERGRTDRNRCILQGLMAFPVRRLESADSGICSQLVQSSSSSWLAVWPCGGVPHLPGPAICVMRDKSWGCEN